MDPYIHNPFPQSLLRTRQSFLLELEFQLVGPRSGLTTNLKFNGRVVIDSRKCWLEISPDCWLLTPTVSVAMLGNSPAPSSKDCNQEDSNSAFTTSGSNEAANYGPTYCPANQKPIRVPNVAASDQL